MRDNIIIMFCCIDFSGALEGRISVPGKLLLLSRPLVIASCIQVRNTEVV